MTHRIHGTLANSTREHPMLDLPFWESVRPLALGNRRAHGWYDSPCKIALREQQVREMRSKGDLGPSVPADVFAWSFDGVREKPWLTRIGGIPWRPKGKPWPCDENGIPLAFLGQICFVDSMDVLPCKLPGMIALIYGTASQGWISLDAGSALEWSPLKIAKPADLSDVPWTGMLPFEYTGVIHRTVQYTDRELSDVVFKQAGYSQGGFQIAAFQATSIGTHAFLPQMTPMDSNPKCTLIATLSTVYFRDEWPLCDVRQNMIRVSTNWGEGPATFDHAHDFGIGDAGCVFIYRDEHGNFVLDGCCA